MDWAICPLPRRFFSGMVQRAGVSSRIGPTLLMPLRADGSTSSPGARSAAVASSSDPAGCGVTDLEYLEIRLLEEGLKTGGPWCVPRPADNRDEVILPEHPHQSRRFRYVAAPTNNCPEILRRRRIGERSVRRPQCDGLLSFVGKQCRDEGLASSDCQQRQVHFRNGR